MLEIIPPSLRIIIRSAPKEFWDSVLSWSWLASNIVGIIGTMLAFGAFIYTRKQLEFAKQEAIKADEQYAKQLAEAEKQTRESEINNAWGILARQGGGNMGKKQALETLARHKIPLVGIDVSGTKDNPAYLVNLSLMHDKVDLSHAKFNNVDLYEARFENTSLNFAEFQNVNLRRSNFYGADGYGGLTLTKFFNTDLSYAYFHSVSLHGPVFNNVNLYQAKFSKVIMNIVPETRGELLKTFDNCYISHTEFFPLINITTLCAKEREQYLPKLDESRFHVYLTDRQHFNEKGEHDGYYIEIELKDEK